MICHQWTIIIFVFALIMPTICIARLLSRKDTVQNVGNVDLMGKVCEMYLIASITDIINDKKLGWLKSCLKYFSSFKLKLMRWMKHIHVPQCLPHNLQCYDILSSFNRIGLNLNSVSCNFDPNIKPQIASEAICNGRCR